jgi:hypothetical protein
MDSIGMAVNPTCTSGIFDKEYLMSAFHTHSLGEEKEIRDYYGMNNSPCFW